MDEFRVSLLMMMMLLEFMLLQKDYGSAYGHLGATYGYNSMVATVPGLNLTIAVGTNVESDYQAQPRLVAGGGKLVRNSKNMIIPGSLLFCSFAV